MSFTKAEVIKLVSLLNNSNNCSHCNQTICKEPITSVHTFTHFFTICSTSFCASPNIVFNCFTWYAFCTRHWGCIRLVSVPFTFIATTVSGNESRCAIICKITSDFFYFKSGRVICLNADKKKLVK